MKKFLFSFIIFFIIIFYCCTSSYGATLYNDIPSADGFIRNNYKFEVPNEVLNKYVSIPVYWNNYKSVLFQSNGSYKAIFVNADDYPDFRFYLRNSVQWLMFSDNVPCLIADFSTDTPTITEEVLGQTIAVYPQDLFKVDGVLDRSSYIWSTPDTLYNYYKTDECFYFPLFHDYGGMSDFYLSSIVTFFNNETFWNVFGASIVYICIVVLFVFGLNLIRYYTRRVKK